MTSGLLSGWRRYDLLTILIMILVYQQDSVQASKLPAHSFEPPFRDIDNSGLRMVNTGWRTGGATVINKNFVRLTPDQQSKRGALWSRGPLVVPSFSVILKFRISGKGRTFYGDGIALWFVQQPYYTEGEVHGFQEHYTGIGIIFDTFRNTENPNSHRDVTVLINDGEQTWAMMTNDVKGCNMLGIRYDANRADFKVTDTSQAKIMFSGKNLTIQVDPRGDGTWHDCVSIPDVGLPDDWTRRAYVGLTASTGQLSDNHDVISLATYSTEETMEKALSDSEILIGAGEKLKPLFDPAPQGMILAERLIRLEVALDRLANRLEAMAVHHEQQFASAVDNIGDIEEKLNIREHEDAVRLEKLESVIVRELRSQDTDKAILELEKNMHISIESKTKSFEENQINNYITHFQNSTGWKTPFTVLLLLIIGSGIAFFFYYKKIVKKMHNT